ncbi:winged helix-turn-helix domain-containing protein [Candidatus Nitrosotalea okcheonensis]|uniref:winged helix-turn-helix domain-containing protein n=1 Tax=Candidatus Nitrosotalea okcheonensis TaxID=1903276 RepID=UPI001300038E|nr:winged helix-turn-helix domain-containing protein [Candidatus Nitrosotalea okcheonensis]
MDDHRTHDENFKRSIVDNDQKSVYSRSNYEYSYGGKKKRTELGQLLQILEYIGSSNNTQISSIARSNNMSHDAATRNCEKLVSVGLVTGETINDNKRYRLTSEGRSFLNECRNFEDILCRYNLCHALYH